MANNDIPAYPMMFSQDQWSNKYSPFAGKPIPFPAQYQGTPTDALGRPIQSYLDAQAAAPPAQAPPVTLNSTPATGTPGWQTIDPTAQAGQQGQTWNPGSSQAQASRIWQAAQGAGQGQYLNALTNQGMAPWQQQKPAAPAGPDMNAAYLAALANPGKVQTPGATVAQSPTPSNQSGVLQQFLANWKAGGGQTQGAGNYNNKGFFNALQGQV
jgi:hypothetical protein